MKYSRTSMARTASGSEILFEPSTVRGIGGKVVSLHDFRIPCLESACCFYDWSSQNVFFGTRNQKLENCLNEYFAEFFSKTVEQCDFFQKSFTCTRGSQKVPGKCL